VDKRISDILKTQQYRSKAKNTTVTSTPPSEIFFEKNDYYQRPLITSNHSSPYSTNYGPSSYFQKMQMGSPGMTPRQMDGEQRLLSNEEDGYFEDVRQTYRQYSPQLSIQGLPSYPASPLPQFMTRNNGGYSPINTPNLPSASCANEQRYQTKNYP
jgi:hypothetical protein